MRASHDSRRQRGQQGQILLVFAGGLVMLLLIAGLVIDLGISFMTRRHEQNAVDPAAIAAARYIRTSGGPDLASMWQAACFYALQNDFRPTQIGGPNNNAPCDASGAVDGSAITVSYPPSADAGDFSGRIGFVEVSLSKQDRTFFAGLIGLNQIGVSSSAVGAYSSGDSNANALIALDPTTDCNTGFIHGTGGGTLKVNVGGSVHVNSKCPIVPPPASSSCLASGSAGLAVNGTNASLTTPAGVSVSGECATNGSGATITTGSPGNAVSQGAVQIGDPLGELQPPTINTGVNGQSCGGGTPTDATIHNSGCGNAGMSWQGSPCPDKTSITCVTLNPGVYYGGWAVGTHLRLLLNPGIYVIAGGGISQTSTGAIDALTDSNGNPGHVLIYGTDNPVFNAACLAVWAANNKCQGPLQFTAQSTVKAYGLDAATCTAIPSTCPYQGMFLWQDGWGNGRGSCPTWTVSVSDCPITVGGSVTMDVAGTIYAPTQQVKVDGGALAGSDGTATVQIISWAWDIGGNATLNMPYDPTQLYHFDQKGLVH